MTTTATAPVPASYVWTEPTARLVIGDTLTVLRSLPDQSVDLILSSPPFLAVRTYLPTDHPDKELEIGMEGSPGAFIDRLVEVAEECRRVLADHGSLCWELGDTYANSGGAGGDYNDGGFREGQAKWIGTAARARVATDDRHPRPKSLSLIPELFRVTLTYGVNPLTGRETEPWVTRNVVRWFKPNPSVGSLGKRNVETRRGDQRFRTAVTDMLVATTSGNRYFDLEGVRRPLFHEAKTATTAKRPNPKDQFGLGPYDGSQSAGAPPLDWWAPIVDDLDKIVRRKDATAVKVLDYLIGAGVVEPDDAFVMSTQGFTGAHYATWPERLCVVPVKSMCPEWVCGTCGLPSERVVTTKRDSDPDDSTRAKNGNGALPDRVQNRPPEIGWEYTRSDLGWTDCGHDDWRRGVVLDPFAGSGTTLKVAVELGRDALGIDIDKRSIALSIRRRVPNLRPTFYRGDV